MGNIISIASDTSNWVKLSSKIKEYILAKGRTDQDAMNFINYFKPIYDSFQFKYAIDAETEVFDDIKGQFNKHISKLVLERLTSELNRFCEAHQNEC